MMLVVWKVGEDAEKTLSDRASSHTIRSKQVCILKKTKRREKIRQMLFLKVREGGTKINGPPTR